jgi:hypothetical protein
MKLSALPIIRNILAIIGLVCATIIPVIVLLDVYATGVTVKLLAYSDFMHEIEHGHIQAVAMRGHFLVGSLPGSVAVQAEIPSDIGLADKLIAKQVKVTALPSDAADPVALVLAWVPLAIWLLSLSGRSWRDPCHALNGASNAR